MNSAPLPQLIPQLLFERTSVHPPYCAFHDIWPTPNGLGASLVPEHQMEDESGPIAAAEAGRHLAILGSYAAALTNDTRRYYLAKAARLERLAGWPGSQRTLVADAQMESMDRRHLSIRATLSAGVPVFALTCHYQILPGRMFERLFAQHRVEAMHDLVASPFSTPLELASVTPVCGGLEATCAPLPPAACAGHFPNYPAFPVAVVMHSLSRLAGRALQAALGYRCGYSVTRADVSADNLIFADQSLQLRTVLTVSEGDLYRFDCLASSEGGVAGKMQLELERCAR